MIMPPRKPPPVSPEGLDRQWLVSRMVYWRNSRRLFWWSWGLFFPVGFVGLAISWPLGGGGVGATVLGVADFLLMVVSTLRLVYFRCPRCKRQFARGFNPWPTRCKTCGLDMHEVLKMRDEPPGTNGQRDKGE
jgi:hypothetical protein